MKRSVLLTGGLLSVGMVVAAASVGFAAEAFAAVVAKTAGMVGDAGAQELARKHGLQVLNVTWEDTGRFKGSCVGDNITDLTIQVRDGDRLTCMPVIRGDNFADKTGDVPLDRFKLLVGNERSGDLETVTLREYLGNVRRYLSKPLSWKGQRTSLLAPRDTHALVSAQACFLPIPREGKAEFNPVLFNYQGALGDPAILAILVTREGTSATVLDNARDTSGWGQRVFFNHKGEKAMLTGERLSDFTDRVQAAIRQGEKVDLPDVNLSQVLLIQVPLKQKVRPARGLALGGAPCDAAAECCKAQRAESNVEAAVVGHGKVEGPFVEIADLEIERDERFPVRVTVQFYKATSNGVVSEADMSAIAKEIEGVYAKAENVGSLVTQGETGRPTEHAGAKVERPDWWEQFWARHEKATGVSREKSIAKLQELLGRSYQPADVRELVEAVRFCDGPAGETNAAFESRVSPCGGVRTGRDCGTSDRVEATLPFTSAPGTRVLAGLAGLLAIGFVVIRTRR